MWYSEDSHNVLPSAIFKDFPSSVSLSFLCTKIHDAKCYLDILDIYLHIVWVFICISFCS